MRMSILTNEPEHTDARDVTCELQRENKPKREWRERMKKGEWERVWEGVERSIHKKHFMEEECTAREEGRRDPYAKNARSMGRKARLGKAK